MHHLLRVVVAVLLRQGHRRAAVVAARDDRHLVDRVGVLLQVLHDGVAGLVVGGGDLFLFVDHAALAGPAPADLVARFFQVVLLDVFLAGQRRAQGGFVDDGGQIGAAEARAWRGPGASGRRWARASPCGCGPSGFPCGPSRRAAARRSADRSGPGRVRAGSSTSTRLVAAQTITWSLVSKPSISTRMALSVCSRSSCPPLENPLPRRRPTASISSRKMMHGLLSLACLNRSRTRLAPTPTNISTKSEPLMREERARRPRRRWPWPAGSCRCPARRPAARRGGCGRRGAGISWGS